MAVVAQFARHWIPTLYISFLDRLYYFEAINSKTVWPRKFTGRRNWDCLQFYARTHALRNWPHFIASLFKAEREHKDRNNSGVWFLDCLSQNGYQNPQLMLPTFVLIWQSVSGNPSTSSSLALHVFDSWLVEWRKTRKPRCNTPHRTLATATVASALHNLPPACIMAKLAPTNQVRARVGCSCNSWLQGVTTPYGPTLGWHSFL